MKSFIGFAVLLLSFSTSGIFAAEKAIYGQDSRREIIEANELQQNLARSVAVRIHDINLKDEYNGYYSIEYKSLASRSGVCLNERYARQNAVTTCTGFLIADDLLVTAGHCMKTAEDCSDESWVFDYQVESWGQSHIPEVKKENVYHCQKVLLHNYAPGKDWAIIKLNRKVRNRRPLELSSHELPKSTTLFVIGSPDGLPLKLATGSVRDNYPNFFVTNLDTFSGNSGSPVFNSFTGVVHGIVVRGEEDYEQTTARCKRNNVFLDHGGRGEQVQKIHDLVKYLGK